ncbi:MAG: glycosyl hydrolase 53 family protein [Suilimivivens sp.]
MKRKVKCAALMTMMLTGSILLAACKSTETGAEEKGQGTAQQESVQETKETVIEAAEPISFEGSAAEASDIYVAPVEGMTDDFIRGVDISSYMAEIESGVVYKDFEGNELDEAGFFNLLAQSGVNCVRIRVWNDPYDKDGNSYGGGHNDLNTAITMGQWATRAGLQVMVDFHYSDFWADPSKQKAPKEWAHLFWDEKQQAFYDYTKASMEALLDAGVNVTMVQVGNEINNGLSGETDREKINTLLSQGSSAIREVSKEKDKEIQIVVHYTNPDSSSLPDYAEGLKTSNVDYDVFAVSYYPFWHGTREKLVEQLSAIAGTYGKKVMVAETSYAYTNEDGDGNANSISTETTGIVLNYDISVQGQVNEVRDVIEAVKQVGDAGIGVFYWEPAWIPVQVYDADRSDAAKILEENKKIWEEKGSGWASSFAASYDPKDAGVYYGGSSWDNQAMFDFEGNPLESLKVYKYVFGGTTAELAIVKVEDIALESGIGQEVRLPEQIPALLNSNETMNIPVMWNEEQVAAAQEGGAGVYEIEGIAEDEGTQYPVVCTLEIKKVNYVKNPGLEEADMSMWQINGKGVGRENDNNKKSGDYSLKFWSADAVSYTVEQEITGIPQGNYELGTFLQGGDAGSNPVFELYIIVNGETYTAQTGVTSWQNWDNPVITDIEIPADAQVTVGVKVEAAAGAWGAWDDFYLYEME